MSNGHVAFVNGLPSGLPETRALTPNPFNPLIPSHKERDCTEKAGKG